VPLQLLSLVVTAPGANFVALKVLVLWWTTAVGATAKGGASASAAFTFGEFRGTEALELSDNDEGLAIADSSGCCFEG